MPRGKKVELELEAVENAAHTRPSNALAAKACGCSRRIFVEFCRQHGIETPGERNKKAGLDVEGWRKVQYKLERRGRRGPPIRRVKP